MGRIIVSASIENGLDASLRIQSDALVDTGATYLTLPSAWRERLGQLRHLDTVSVETATQAVVSGDICGPVLLRMGEFRPVLTEVLFIEMDAVEGRYEPLIGQITLGTSPSRCGLGRPPPRQVRPRVPQGRGLVTS